MAREVSSGAVRCNTPRPSSGNLGLGPLRIRRWGRVVVVASFMSFLLHGGVLGTFGAFLPTFIREFQNGSGQLGWVVSSGIAVENFSGPLGNFVVRRIGCRRAVMLGGALIAFGTASASFATSVFHLFVCLGLIAGFGGSLNHVAIIVAVGQYYSRHYTVANGIAYAGPGAGLFIFPPLIQYLMENYGWKGSLIIEAAIVSHVMVFGALFRPASRFKSGLRKSCDIADDVIDQMGYDPVISSEEEKNVRCSVKDKCSDSGISELSTESCVPEETLVVKSADDKCTIAKLQSSSVLKQKPRRKSLLSTTDIPSVIAMFTACVFHTAGYSGVSVHLVNQAVSSGMSTRQAAILLSCVGIGSLIGRLTHGWFLTRKCITPSWMYTASLLVSVVATVTLPSATTVGRKIACAATVGICSGIYFSLVVVILRELVGIHYLGVAFGISLFCSGLGTALGGYVIGILKDVTRSYQVPSYLISAFFAVAAVASILLTAIFRYRAYKARCKRSESTPV